MKKQWLMLGLVFIFGAQIKVVKGFYKGCTGVVTGYEHDSEGRTNYRVDLEKVSANGVNTYTASPSLPAEDLEAVKKVEDDE